MRRMLLSGLRFLSTPSARRATSSRPSKLTSPAISIHALREEGDGRLFYSRSSSDDFYPRPPRGGRPGVLADLQLRRHISIHALREEGDFAGLAQLADALPFLSTPSARRATRHRRTNCPLWQNFYPRPPRGGRPSTLCPLLSRDAISIHALREEGDPPTAACRRPSRHFYPRPPRGGRPTGNSTEKQAQMISIHALREEGDPLD